MDVASVDIRNYAFIDGNYLRRAYEGVMQKWAPGATFSDIDFEKIKIALSASKVFYYDSVDEEAPDAEARRAFLDSIRSLDGFHVRQGTITKQKKKKRKQKQVDVQLAVDMLTHAFNKNFWHASLIAGDLDFKPLVDALIQLGSHVHVYYEPESCSKGLYHAADVSVAIKMERFWWWSSNALTAANPIPTRSNTLPAGLIEVKTGSSPYGSVTLHQPPDPKDHHYLVVAGLDPPCLRHRQPDRLCVFFEMNYAPIIWNETKPPE